MVSITYTITNTSSSTITDPIQLQLNAGGHAILAPFAPTGHLSIAPNTLGPFGTTVVSASFVVGSATPFQANLTGWYAGGCLYLTPVIDQFSPAPGQNFLTIDKSVVTPGPYHPGDLVQYEVRIGFPANANAPSVIQQVVMEDVLPAGVTNTGNVSANLVANSSPTVLLSTPQSITNGGAELVYTYEVAIGAGVKACQNIQNCASIINASALCGTPTYCELIYVEEANPVTLGFIPPVYTSCPGVCDATVTVPVLGGVGPFDLGIHTVSLSAPCPVGYSAISNVFSGLGPGLHEITVQDQGSFCTYAFILEVFDAPPIVWGALTAVSNVSCPGGSDGSITVGASGGTGSLTFTWSNGATGPTASGLSAGSYDVTVTDDNGCSDVQTLQITEPGPITWSEQITNPVTCHAACDGEVTIANIQGGTPPYTVWFDNVAQPVGQVVFPGLCEGIYDVNIEDANGCLSPYPVSLVLPNSAPATWHKTTENNFGDDMGDDIVVDDEENVYVTGTFHEWTNLPDQSNPQTLIIGPGTNGMFVAKYDRCGDLQWARIGYFSGNPLSITGSVTGTGVTVDHSNNRV
ncbi:MAG: hypothetical protein AAGB22_01770, partial [Bacteroidota bacterium]